MNLNSLLYPENKSAMGDWAFQYDTLNRLTVAAPADNAPSSYVSRLGCFAYDGFGNRTLEVYTITADCNSALATRATYSAGNQVTFVSQSAPVAYSAPSGFTYDLAGNVIADGQNQYAYDGEGRLCAVYNTLTKSYTGYLYNAAGTRTAAGTITSLSCNLATNGFAMSREYLLDLGGDQVTELSGTGAWKHSNVWAGAHLAATYDTKGLHFHLSDPLGTRRVQTNVLGQVENSFQSLPFGDGYVAVPTALATADDATENHFTAKERDAESGNDYFGARYYASSMGRFLSADPVVITPERLANPQQLNLYAYVANNPLRFIDPTGEILQCVGDAKSQSQCFSDLQQIAGDAASRLSMDAKTGVVSFDTKDLDMSKNEGAALVNDLVGSKNTFDFSVGPTIMTDKGPVRIDKISVDLANLPTFGDQPKSGNPPAGVSDILGLFLNNPNIERVSNTNLKVAPEWTVAFHELAEAFAKIDGGKGGSYEQGHNAALQREMTLRDQRPYLKQYNTGAGGPANSPNPQGGIIIKK